jgi:hypothetical protein
MSDVTHNVPFSDVTFSGIKDPDPQAMKEINRIKIIQDVIERQITTRRAAPRYQRQAMPQTSCPLP